VLPSATVQLLPGAFYTSEWLQAQRCGHSQERTDGNGPSCYRRTVRLPYGGELYLLQDGSRGRTTFASVSSRSILPALVRFRYGAQVQESLRGGSFMVAGHACSSVLSWVYRRLV
jgi:hypothetical protein